MSITVQASLTTVFGVGLEVQVLTGAVEAGGASAGATASPPDATLTPVSSNSYVVFGCYNESGTTAFTAAANNTMRTNASTGGSTKTGSGTYTGTVTAGTGITAGASAPTGQNTSMAAYEVQPSGGSTPLLDASSPAFVSGTSPQTTAAFTPPAGAVLVAIVTGATASAATPAVSDSSGLTWTLRKQSQNTGTGTDTSIFTATVGGGGGITSTGALALPGPAMAGAGTATISGSGGLALPGPAMAGAGTATISGSGGLALPGPKMAGASLTPVTSSGGLSLPGPKIAGTGTANPPSLIISLAAKAGTDDFGTSFPEGVQVGAAGPPQVSLLPGSVAAEIQFPVKSASPALSNPPNIAAALIGALAQLVVSGPASGTAGDKDWVQQVAFSNDAAGHPARMEFRYISNAQAVTVMGSYDGANGWIFDSAVQCANGLVVNGNPVTFNQQLTVNANTFINGALSSDSGAIFSDGSGDLTIGNGFTLTPKIATPPNTAAVKAGTATLAQAEACLGALIQSMQNRGMVT